MDTLTVLESAYGQPLTKQFVKRANKLTPEHPKIPKLFNVENHQVENLQALSEALSILESEQTRAVIRGELREGFPTKHVVRQCANASAPFQPAVRQWICIDLDKLDIPEELADFNVNPEAVAKHAADQLPEAFWGYDFHWQFSSSMGVKPGIRIHLWYWLNRPISDAEAKGWLTQSRTRVDPALYNPVQLHFTAAPIFDPPEADPVNVRSGLFEHGNGLIEAQVPDGLEELAAEASRTRRQKRLAPDGIHLEDDRIVRDEDGKVIDGREWFLFIKSREACKELTKGKSLKKDIPSVDEIAELTWKLFKDEADLSDGRWSPEDAIEKAQYRHRDLEDGWKPNARGETTALVPDVDPYFNIEPLPIEKASELLDHHLSNFFQSVREKTPKKMTLRVTMGAGKTTEAIKHLKALLNENPELNVEIYLPRHILIRELLPKFEGVNEGIEVIHVRGRGETAEGEEPPCQRYGYVHSLEIAGLPVWPNACWRSEHEKCQHYDGCVYWQQFRHSLGNTGSVRLFPHNYLSIQRVGDLPEPDIVIVDESFIGALHVREEIPAAAVGTLFRETDQPELGDLIASSLRDAEPLLGILRDHGIDSDWLRAVDFREDTQPFQFKTFTDESEDIDGREEKRLKLAESFRDVLAAELELEGREHPTRLRYNHNDHEFIIDQLITSEIPHADHLLILDATANEMILNKLFPNIEFHSVDFEQRAIVTQVFDRTGSNVSWNKGEDRVENLILLLQEQTLVGDEVLCVSHMKLADHLREQKLGEQIKIEHFGNLRGIDSYKDCNTVFITGRNQPKQADMDGLARALWWDDEPLQHNPAALLGAPPEVNLPTELRGYLTVDPDQAAGVYVRSFSDPRIEAIHQQVREAETVHAIARLRLVHAKWIKHVYLLGNLPIEMPINRVVEWNQLMLNSAERELIKKGNIPLTPMGWLKMRPDLKKSEDQAKNLNKRSRVNEPQELLQATPLLLRLSPIKLEFRQMRDGKPFGRTHAHLFRPKNISVDKERPGVAMVANLSFPDWERYLVEGDPNIEGSGWGPIKITSRGELNSPSGIIAYEQIDGSENDHESAA